MADRTRTMTAPLGLTLTVVPGATPGDSTLVVLHGSDGRETDLLPFAARVDPAGACIALRGAVRTELGHAFFDRRPDRTFDDDAVSARIAPLVDAIELGQQTVGRARHTTVLGFSNGAVMAAALLERRPELFTGGVLLRPQAPFRSSPRRSELALPVLVIDGRLDARRSTEDGARTAERLRRAGAGVEHVTLGVGHGITDEDERAVRDWLRNRQPAAPGGAPRAS
ncbi:hypothetical protein [Curtobacterium sp. 458]|uniref:alpha/beta hydrolase n=1 Tax=Curtobacterium sp. 458 TaxID=3050069 RepID=UPI0025B28B66|nr:hypothetical protein [Curtobacterium sp. 458]WJY01085.1 hypothetical protein QPJ90_05160 [Curtobacterium sp. 458]